MTQHDALTLGDVDADGALQETAERAGLTRGDALRRAVLGGGALVGGSALLGALPGSAFGASTRMSASTRASSDVDILNFALTLEYLEAAFYAEAVSKGALKGEATKFARVVAKDEAAHVAFLKGALGSKAVAKPKFDFKGTTASQATFLKTAMALEDTGVSAYAGAAPMIADKKTLSAALSVHSVEARHAAWVRDILGKGGNPLPAPAAFDAPRTQAQVLAIVKSTGFISGM
jgi:rubrerythrin